MDDTFVLFSSIDHVQKFNKYLNSRYENTTFTYEVEQNNCIYFSDVLVTRKGDSFSTSLYRKPLLMDCTLISNSYISDKYKKGLIFSLLFRVLFTVDWNKFHIEVECLKKKFTKNSYLMHFIDKCIKTFFNKKLIPLLYQVTRSGNLIPRCPLWGRILMRSKRRSLDFLKNSYLTPKLILSGTLPRNYVTFLLLKEDNHQNLPSFQFAKQNLLQESERTKKTHQKIDIKSHKNCLALPR